MNATRKAYPGDVSDVEWEFLAPYLTLMREDAPSRTYPPRDLFDALRYVVRTGIPWRMMPHDFPLWDMAYQQARRWLHSNDFEAIAQDPRIIERILKKRDESPSALIFDARTLQSTPESGGRAGYDGHKKKQGSKVHIAVGTLGDLLSVVVTVANEQERDQVATRAAPVQRAPGGTVALAYVDQGYTG